jgi:septum formation protein
VSAPRLILASASVTRRRMLEAAGLNFTAIASDVDEESVKRAARAEGARAAETAFLLAEMKAQKVAARNPRALVIGADQILVCENIWFDKPGNLQGARTQLKALRGRVHVLETAVVCYRGGARQWFHVTRPKLTMRSFSDAFLETYLAAERDHILGNVGAYRLEGWGAQLFDQIEGDFFSVLGLPLLPLLSYLRHARVLGG